ncbi:MAG TPA: hypothetical protein VGW35_05640 [Methylomirabilota bacterium]|jgi:hypothetical protein|nr:hypothetical protein [Methylomirabilota bacterium]
MGRTATRSIQSRLTLLTALLIALLSVAPSWAQSQTPAQKGPYDLPQTPPMQSGAYRLDAETRPHHVKPGGEVTIVAIVTPSQAAQSQRVDVEILDGNNQKLAQQIYSDQNFVPGQTKRYAWKWRVPANFAPGKYTVKVGIFSADWQQLVAWDNQASMFVVVGPTQASQ